MGRQRQGPAGPAARSAAGDAAVRDVRVRGPGHARPVQRRIHVEGLGQRPAAGFASTQADPGTVPARSEEHTSELQSLMRISYAVFCLKKKKNTDTLIII